MKLLFQIFVSRHFCSAMTGLCQFVWQHFYKYIWHDIFISFSKAIASLIGLISPSLPPLSWEPDIVCFVGKGCNCFFGGWGWGWLRQIKHFRWKVLCCGFHILTPSLRKSKVLYETTPSKIFFFSSTGHKAPENTKRGRQFAVSRHETSQLSQP